MIDPSMPPLNAIDSSEHFDAAIEAIRKRVPMPKDEWLRLSALERESAFTVAHVTEADVLQQVLDSLQSSVTHGTDFEQFKDDCYLQLLESWGGERPMHMETVFRTNLSVSYSEGRHSIYSSPTVKEARPYLRCDGAEDDRMCEECEELHGVIRPQEDWAKHTTPFHFNAVAGTSKILTDQGEVEASRVHPGMLVATHARRWRTVTAVLHKPANGKNVRALHLASGRILRATDEHPVLVRSVAGTLQWKLCGELQVGDQVFEYVDEVPGAHCGLSADTHDVPAILGQPSVSDLVVGIPRSEPVVLPVDLQVDTLGDKREIHHVLAEAKLGRHSAAKDAGEECLTWGEFLAPGVGDCGAGSLSTPWHVHRIAFDHATGNVRQLEPPRPVVLSASLGHGLGTLHGDAGALGLAPGGDAVANAPLGDEAVGQPKFPFQIADAPVLREVLGGNEGGEFSLGMKEGALRRCVHVSAIITIVDTKTSEELCDLSVDGDETYFADGILVHNCRHQLTPLSREEAVAEGIDDEMPDVELDDGFGEEPSKQGENWDFDLSRFDPDLRELLEEKLAAYRDGGGED